MQNSAKLREKHVFLPKICSKTVFLSKFMVFMLPKVKIGGNN